MMKKKEKANYLDFIPVRNPELAWETGEDGMIVLLVPHNGLMERLTQKLLRKPKLSYIHMEQFGSFIWPLIDGQRTVYEIGLLVREAFGQDAEPLFERLATYFEILKQNRYISFLPESSKPSGA